MVAALWLTSLVTPYAAGGQMRLMGPCKSVQGYWQCLPPFRVAALTRLKRKRCLILQSNVNGMEDFEREQGATISQEFVLEASQAYKNLEACLPSIGLKFIFR